MDSKEAADIVRAVSASLRGNPGQFQIQVSMAGFSAQNTGGIGYLAQNTGGIGFNSGMGNANIQISNQQAGGAVDAAFENLLSKIDSIEEQLRQPVPDEGKLKALADAIYAEKWVPEVIGAVIVGLLNSVGL